MNQKYLENYKANFAAKLTRNLPFCPRNCRDIINSDREIAAKLGVLQFRGTAKFKKKYRDKCRPLSEECSSFWAGREHERNA